jgi:phytoene dehydrogenase-like protein
VRVREVVAACVHTFLSHNMLRGCAVHVRPLGSAIQLSRADPNVSKICLLKLPLQVIPDIRERTELELIGSPLTHQRYLRRHRGTYGPAISARTGSFPGPATSLPGLYGCGDSYMPGIGVPAAAASGMIAANTLVSLPKHLSMLRQLQL